MEKESVIKKIFKFIYKKAEYVWENREEIRYNLEEKVEKRRTELENKMDVYYDKYYSMEFSYLEEKCRKLVRLKKEKPNYTLSLEENVMIRVYNERRGS